MMGKNIYVTRRKEQCLSCLLLIVCIFATLVVCKRFCDFLVMAGVTILPLTMYIYYSRWSISICKSTITYRKMFRERTYLTAQILRVCAYSSSAERGEVLWVYFSNGESMKVAHSYQNYAAFRSYIMKHRSIEWK